MASEQEYSPFDQLDGQHPWKDAVPEGYVSYPVRVLSDGKVVYFNFQLAKDMGLIPKDHPHKITKSLETKLLQTFNLRIINEFDVERKINFDPKTIKPTRFMATRYLQLQHGDKTGRTSGDGRCIWNGFCKHGGELWDVNSRGTGVTILAPGAVEAGQPLRSGNNDVGYGCGTAEIDELVGSAILSEIFYNSGIESERVLTVIDNGRGQGIGVRAAKNMIRPAHVFMYLKQGQLPALKRSVDYFIDRQRANHEYSFSSRSQNSYDYLLKELVERFAKFTAMLEREYIFAWLDWDGDNLLMQPGIIDYGSIRQFGLRHDMYRYDDIQRWSTNLNGQRLKAAQIVQTFAQMIDYLKTGRKKSVGRFSKSPAVKAFQIRYDHYLKDYFLFQAGYSHSQRKVIFRFFPKILNKLYRSYMDLEQQKTKAKIKRVADGVNRPAIFNMRKILWSLPKYYSTPEGRQSGYWMGEEAFFANMITSHANRSDQKLTPRVRKKIENFQSLYQDLLLRVTGVDQKNRIQIRQIAIRSQEANPSKKITGNALIFVVEEIIKFRKKGLPEADLQNLIERLISIHSPMKKRPVQSRWKNPSIAEKLYKKVSSIITDYAEEI